MDPSIRNSYHKDRQHRTLLRHVLRSNYYTVAKLKFRGIPYSLPQKRIPPNAASRKRGPQWRPIQPTMTFPIAGQESTVNHCDRYQPVKSRSRVCVHVSPHFLPLPPPPWFAKYGRSGGVRVCLSRPAVSKANDLPWNLDNLSAAACSRLQPPRPGLHLFRGEPLLPSLSVVSRQPPLTSIHPSRFKARYQLHRGCSMPPTLYLSFTVANGHE